MGDFMSRFAIASAAAVLMSATLADAAEPIAVRDMGSSHVDEVAIDGNADKQRTIIGYQRLRVDPNGSYEVEPIYALPQAERGARSNIVGVTASGRVIFCFCGEASF
jgi:hypothetical protein